MSAVTRAAAGPLPIAICAVALAWPVALLTAPCAAARPARSLAIVRLAAGVYAAGRFICHQKPERSFHIRAVQLPVCARCFGLYAGGAAGALGAVVLGGSRRRPRRGFRAARSAVLLAAVPTALTWMAEWVIGVDPGNLGRALAAAPLALVFAWMAVMEIESGPAEAGRHV